MTAGIYCLTNKINGKKYIGQSMDVDTRVGRHFRHSVFENITGPLYDALKEHSKDCWELDVLWKAVGAISRQELHQKEIEFIALFNTTNPEKGYNVSTGGHGTNGVKHSDEARQKIRESKIGELNPRFGVKLSKETKQKMSAAKEGVHNHMFGKTGEQNPMFGKKHSEEAKRKMREARKRRS